jgi:hypothetical protein
MIVDFTIEERYIDTPEKKLSDSLCSMHENSISFP